MVKDHSDNERKKPLLFPISRKGIIICTISQDSTYPGICYTSHGALAGTGNCSMDGRYTMELWIWD